MNGPGSEDKIMHWRTSKALLEVTLTWIESLDGCERLADLLQSNYGLALVKRVDGPDASAWRLVCGENNLSLDWDDWGIVNLRALAPADEPFVMTLGDRLAEDYRDPASILRSLR